MRIIHLSTGRKGANNSSTSNPSIYKVHCNSHHELSGLQALERLASQPYCCQIQYAGTGSFPDSVIPYSRRVCFPIFAHYVLSHFSSHLEQFKVQLTRAKRLLCSRPYVIKIQRDTRCNCHIGGREHTFKKLISSIATGRKLKGRVLGLEWSG